MKITIIFERFIVLMWKHLNFQLFCFCYSVVNVGSVFTEAQPGSTLTALCFEIAYSLLRKTVERKFQILTLMNFYEPLEIKSNFQQLARQTIFQYLKLRQPSFPIPIQSELTRQHGSISTTDSKQYPKHEFEHKCAQQERCCAQSSPCSQHRGYVALCRSCAPLCAVDRTPCDRASEGVARLVRARLRHVALRAAECSSFCMFTAPLSLSYVHPRFRDHTT